MIKPGRAPSVEQVRSPYPLAGMAIEARGENVRGIHWDAARFSCRGDLSRKQAGEMN